MNEGRISCKNVVKKFGDTVALRGIDLDINDGDFLVLLGPNGAGKTTLMKILCGIIRPTSGNATVAGMDVHEPEVRKKVGVISHMSLLYNDLTAMENIVFYGNLYNVPEPEAKAEELLKSVELDKRAGDLARNFSRGMTQRLSIARALVADPDFIFLDEPFTGLDLHSAALFKQLLRQLHGRGKSVIMITHDIEAGIALSTRTTILNSGRMVYDEPTESAEPEKIKNEYLKIVGV
ncbi:MAG: ABC transporter ATP-binding protein [Nitrospinota bacterium]